MKKLVLVAALAGLAMTSCKKDYVCECKLSGTATGTVSEPMTKMKKKDAEKKCDSYDENTPDQTTDCSIK